MPGEALDAPIVPRETLERARPGALRPGAVGTGYGHGGGSGREMPRSTRERIIDEALRLFAERGYSATSVAEIEAASGLSPGAGGLYRHFKSKYEVLAAAIN